MLSIYFILDCMEVVENRAVKKVTPGLASMKHKGKAEFALVMIYTMSNMEKHEQREVPRRWLVLIFLVAIPQLTLLGIILYFKKLS